MPRVISALAIVAVVLGVLFTWRIYQIRQQAEMMSKSPPPVKIEVAQATARRWPEVIDAIGELRAVNGVQVANEIAGLVESLAFESGQRVEAGDVLLQLEAETDEAALATCEAGIAAALLQPGRSECSVAIRVRRGAGQLRCRPGRGA